jgi:hypothetical protein
MPYWTCTICGQVVELRDDDRPRWPVKAYENCKLQHHYVDNACIAYAYPQVAKELIMIALSGVRERPLANIESKARDRNPPDRATTARLRRPIPNPLI